MRVIHKNTDITELVVACTWSGDYRQAARMLEFKVAVHPHDQHLPRVTILMGDMVKLFVGDRELFQGYVFYKEKSIDNSEMYITAYDGLIYLLKSLGAYNFSNMTPGAITRRLCDEFEIPKGNIIEGGPISRIFNRESIYSIIMTAYTLESKKTGKLYMPKMENGKLNIIEKGTTVAEYVLDNESSIINSTYSESIEDSINRVKIYDANGNSIGEVTLDGVPGVLQDIYQTEEGIDPTTGAKAMLKGMERTATIEALADYDCVTGNAVKIKEPYTGMVGLFYIDNDKHVFENNQHTVTLGLSFKNMMDEKEGGSEG